MAFTWEFEGKTGENFQASNASSRLRGSFYFCFESFFLETIGHSTASMFFCQLCTDSVVLP